MADIESVLDQHHTELLKKHPGVLNTAIGKKIVDGKVTDEQAIIVYVQKKLPMAMLKNGEAMPKEINGIKVDVVELSPKTWVAGKTAISQLPPSEQRKMLGGVITSNASMKAQFPKVLSGRKSQISLEVSWRALANKIKHQGGCGSCTAFGAIGIWEICHRQIYNEVIDLSEQFLFTCSGGICSQGNAVSIVLDRALKGVCIEDDLPYAQGSGKDFACRQGIKPGWQTRAKMLKQWYSISNKSDQRLMISRMPMSTTMHVHQSFMNYVGGVYNDVGDTDPIIGFHYVGCIGLSDSKGAWEGRNSWGENWGEEGYFWIAFGASGFDDEMQVLVPSNDTIPDPGPDPIPDPTPDPQPDPNPWPVPSPCRIAKSVLIIPNKVLAVLGHSGRLHYMKPK